MERKAREDAERKAAEKRAQIEAARKALEEAEKETGENWQETLQGLRDVSELREGMNLLGQGGSQRGPAACWNCQTRNQECKPGT